MSTESHVVAVTPANDLVIVKAMVEELEDYIVNEKVYRTVVVRTSQGDQRLQMTGGDLLTRLYRLQMERDRLTPQEQATLDSVAAESEKTIYSLKTRFHQQLVRELKARTDALKWYLEEAATDSTQARTNYAFEIRNRQRIEEIVKALGTGVPQEAAAALASVDRRLRGLKRGDQFVWDASLLDVFPRGVYWYLYAGQ